MGRQVDGNGSAKRQPANHDGQPRPRARGLGRSITAKVAIPVLAIGAAFGWVEYRGSRTTIESTIETVYSGRADALLRQARSLLVSGRDLSDLERALTGDTEVATWLVVQGDPPHVVSTADPVLLANGLDDIPDGDAARLRADLRTSSFELQTTNDRGVEQFTAHTAIPGLFTPTALLVRFDTTLVRDRLETDAERALQVRLAGLAFVTLSVLIAVRVAVLRRVRRIERLVAERGPLIDSDGDELQRIETCIASTLHALEERAAELRASEAEMAHQAAHDALTGLPNRSLLLAQIGELLEQTRRPTASARLCVMFIDLDRFKLVNDSLGHDMGDRLLVETSQRMTTLVGDATIVARLGGDEFVMAGLFAPGTDGLGEVTRLARRIVERTEEPFVLGGTEAFVSASIGIAMAEAGDRAEDLLRKADVAMYRAKAHGKARYEVFDGDMQRWVNARLQSELDLRHAIAEGTLDVHYQPIMRLDSASLHGFEALVRWDRLGFGNVPPDEFIPLAEEAGLISQIGSLVLRKACAQLAEWRESTGADLCIAVNVSSRQIRQGDLVSEVRALIEEFSIAPHRLVLEVTEAMLLEDLGRSHAVLEGLRRLGVHIAVDDFGTGYSSITYLRQLPIDQVKIDKAFVQRLGERADDATIVAAVVALARAMGLDVVAEGTETREQLAALLTLECQLGQGYLFSRPVPADEATRMILTGVGDVAR